MIGGYVWKLLAKQQLLIRRNRPVDEHISMRKKDAGGCFVARSTRLLAIKRRARSCCAVEGTNSGGYSRCATAWRSIVFFRSLSVPSRTEMIYEMIKKVLECG